MLARAFTIVLLACTATTLPAQAKCVREGVPVLVGSEWEQYLRATQLLGAVGLQPWTVRDFGPRQWPDLIPRDSTLPWAQVDPGFTRIVCHRGKDIVVLPLRAQLIYNSRFPMGENDGAIWSGRGVTTAAELGASAAFGPLTITLAPLVFVAQNAAFPIKSNGSTGKRAFADWRNPGEIDLPQRFGASAYGALDPGQSSVRLDAAGLAIGLSTANQFWGPATDHPIILGNNAAGFAHLFFGTARPLGIWRLGRVHGRVMWGKLEQTEYSTLADTAVSRLGSGIALVFQPAFLKGFEIGGARFFHVLQNRFTLDRGELERPFGAILKVARARQIGSASGDETDNQLGSVFARFVLPASGAEVYGEYGREDHNYDLRDLMLMPDHDVAYLLGMRKVWQRSLSLVSLRAEVLNSRVSHLALASTQVPWYIHSSELQGHTNKGQVLGSAGAYGGGGALLALERYDARGRWRLSWERLQFGDYRPARAPEPFYNDVAHVWGANVLRFGRRADIELGMSLVYEMNRYFENDSFNLRVNSSVRPVLHRP